LFYSTYAELFPNFWHRVRNIVLLLFRLQHWILSLFVAWHLALAKHTFDDEYLFISYFFSENEGRDGVVGRVIGEKNLPLA
jgi:hypothetical protein